MRTIIASVLILISTTVTCLGGDGKTITLSKYDTVFLTGDIRNRFQGGSLVDDPSLDGYQCGTGTNRVCTRQYYTCTNDMSGSVGGGTLPAGCRNGNASNCANSNLEICASASVGVVTYGPIHNSAVDIYGCVHMTSADRSTSQAIFGTSRCLQLGQTSISCSFDVDNELIPLGNIETSTLASGVSGSVGIGVTCTGGATVTVTSEADYDSSGNKTIATDGSKTLILNTMLAGGGASKPLTPTGQTYNLLSGSQMMTFNVRLSSSNGWSEALPVDNASIITMTFP